jgi:hypothetical protein
MMSRRGCSLPANASGLDPHRASDPFVHSLEHFDALAVQLRHLRPDVLVLGVPSVHGAPNRYERPAQPRQEHRPTDTNAPPN